MIRAYQEKDLPRVMEIWLACSVTAHRFIEESVWKNLYNTVVREYIPRAVTYVFEESGRVQGFISLFRELSEQADSAKPEKDQAAMHIGALFVSPDAQGEGVGSALLGLAKEKYQSLSLSIYIENKKACRFYERQGFRTVSVGESDFKGHPQRLMRWTLE